MKKQAPFLLAAAFLTFGNFGGTEVNAGPNCPHHQSGVAAPNGGILEHAHNTELNLELVTMGNLIRVYVFDHDMNPLSSSEVSMQSKMVLPRRHGGDKTLELKQEGNSFVGEVAIPESAPFYKVHLEVEKNGQSDKVSFTVEP